MHSTEWDSGYILKQLFTRLNILKEDHFLEGIINSLSMVMVLMLKVTVLRFDHISLTAATLKHCSQIIQAFTVVFKCR